MVTWQTLLERQPESSMTFGLERISAVRDRLQAQRTLIATSKSTTIITVAGTNGKGSTCAFCAELLQTHGARVGLFTSPHVMRFHERIRVNGVEINDESLNRIMQAVETARLEANVALSYFEMTTLTAWWYFLEQNVDVMVLEVGLGGRLDAVNAWSADLAIITTIDLDHQALLGNTREQIALEKAAIARAGRVVLCSDMDPPSSLVRYFQDIRAKAHYINVDFTPTQSPYLADQWALTWVENQQSQILSGLPLPRLRGKHQWRNAAVAIRAVEILLNQQGESLTAQTIRQALITTHVIGRLDYRPRIQGEIEAWLDVAHNAQAARTLAQNLPPALPNQKTWAVLGMLADKDVEEVVRPLLDKIDSWYLGGLNQINPARGLSSADLYAKLLPLIHENKMTCFTDPSIALQALLSSDAQGNDRIIIFGSFHTVSMCYAQLAKAS